MIESLLPTLAAGNLAVPDVGALLAATVPELVLTAGLVAILLMDAFGVSTPRLIPRISMAVIVLTFGITFKALLDDKVVVAGPLTVDTMAVLFRLLFLASAAYMLLFAMRRGHAWFEQAEFQALVDSVSKAMLAQLKT